MSEYTKMWGWWGGCAWVWRGCARLVDGRGCFRADAESFLSLPDCPPELLREGGALLPCHLKDVGDEGRSEGGQRVVRGRSEGGRWYVSPELLRVSGAFLPSHLLGEQC